MFLFGGPIQICLVDPRINLGDRFAFGDAHYFALLTARMEFSPQGAWLAIADYA
jgi:hypothetical protein